MEVGEPDSVLSQSLLAEFDPPRSISNQLFTKVQDGCQRSSETARPRNACPLLPECALCRLRVQAARYDDGGGRAGVGLHAGHHES